MQGLPTDVYEVVLKARDTRQQVVDKCQLQEFFRKERPEEAAEELGRRTELVIKPPTSVTVGVSLKGSPRGLLPGEENDIKVRSLSVAVVNAYVETLSEQLSKLRISSAKSRRVFLEQQKPEAESQLYQAQETLAKWEADRHLVAPPKAAEEMTQRLVEVQAALTEAQIARQVQSRQEEQAREVLTAQPEIVLATRSQQANPEIARLTRELARAEEAIADQQTFYHKTTTHPDVQHLLLQKDKLLEQLKQAEEQTLLPASLVQTRNPARDEILSQLVSAQVQQAALSAKAEGLSTVLAKARREIESLAWASLEYAQLYEEVQMRKAIYETLVTQYEAAVLDEKAEEPTFFVLDPPVRPWKKSSPHLAVNGGLGLLIGLLLGLAWVAIKEPELKEKAVEPATNE